MINEEDTQREAAAEVRKEMLSLMPKTSHFNKASFVFCSLIGNNILCQRFREYNSKTMISVNQTETPFKDLFYQLKGISVKN